MTRLEKEGLVKAASKGKRLGKVINKEMVEDAMKKYFDRSSSNKMGDSIDHVMSQDHVSVSHYKILILMESHKRHYYC